MKKMRQGTSPIIQIMGQRVVPWWLRYIPSRIQFLDDFEGVLKWYQLSGTVTKDSSFQAFEGNYCLKLATGTTAGSEATARLFLSAVPNSKIMFQLRWHYISALQTNPRSFYLKATFYDGSYMTVLGLQHLLNLTTPQQKWQYWSETNAWTDLPGGSQPLGALQKGSQYLMLKADLSVSPPKYIMAELNNLVIDMSTLRPYRYANTEPPRILIDLGVITDAAAETDAYVDAFCFSDQEP
jgi:hypothetical protein